MVSADGLKMIEKRQMHKAIIEFSASENVKAGYHTAVMDQVPETQAAQRMTRSKSRRLRRHGNARSLLS